MVDRTSLSSALSVCVKLGTARLMDGVLLNERNVEDVDDDARCMRNAQREQMEGDAMVL